MKTSNSKFIAKIMDDVTCINFTDEEINKMKVFVRYSTGNLQLFTYIQEIYDVIGKEFSEPGQIILIPYISEGKQHINIQRVK